MWVYACVKRCSSKKLVGVNFSNPSHLELRARRKAEQRRVALLSAQFACEARHPEAAGPEAGVAETALITFSIAFFFHLFVLCCFGMM